MASLAGIQGRSLAPDLTQGLGVLRQAFGTPEIRASRERAAELERLRFEGITGALEESLGTIGGPIEQAGDAGKQARAFERLAIVAPDAAKALQSITVSQNAEAREAFKAETDKGVRQAQFVSKQPDFASKQRAIQSLAAEAARKGQPRERLIELLNKDEAGLDLELQRMKIAGKDIDSILGPQFETVLDAAGNVVAQRQTTTGRVVADPRAASGGGLFSAKTEILADGSTIQAGPSGTVVVRGPDGQPATGAERLEVLRNAQQSELDQARAGSASKAAGKQAISQSGKAIDSLAKIKTSVANIDQAIKLLDEGASTGPIMSRLPSIKSASVALDNVQKAMGLDVIGTTTFGALSKGELDLALSKALPTGLKPDALREWLIEKRDTQEKLTGYLENAAIFLGIPGNTPADWVAQQREITAQSKEFLGQETTVNVGGQPVAVGAVITNSAGQRGRVEADGSITVLP